MITDDEKVVKQRVWIYRKFLKLSLQKYSARVQLKKVGNSVGLD